MYHSFPPDYDANARCDYHIGALGHTNDNFKALKHKVHNLIISKAITFTPSDSNIKSNLMLTHVSPSISVVEESDSQELVTVVEEIHTPMLVIT